MDTMYRMNLRLFDGGAAAGASAGGEGGGNATGSNTGVADQNKQPEKIVYGIQENDPPATDTAPAEENAQNDAQQTKSDPVDKGKAFEDMIKGDYKEQFDARVKQILDRRFKGQDELEKFKADSQEILDLMYAKYGVNDLKSLQKAVQEDDSYFSFAFVDEMPKLNTNNTEVADYLCKVCKEWIEKWNIDGIRFDVGNEISHSFIKRLHRELKQMKPDLFLLGEIWHDSIQWLQGDEYDSVMNYPFMESLNNFFINKNLDSKDFMYIMNRCYSLYMSQVNSVLFNFLDSHDVGRVYSRCDNIDNFFQQLVVLVTMPGTPCIYYGTEIAMDGKCGPYNRKPMPWEEIDCGKYDSIIEEVQSLIRIRKKYKALKGSEIQWKNTKGRFISYARLGDVTIEVYINAGEQQVPIDLPEQEIIFAHKYMNQRLLNGGALIIRRNVK